MSDFFTWSVLAATLASGIRLATPFLLASLGEMIGHSRGCRVDVGSAEILRRHLFAGGGLDQRGAGEENGAVALDDDRLIGHGRHIGATGRAGAEDGRHLRDAVRRHPSLISEDASKVVDVRKHLALHGQEGST